jgi:FkbM family methyltransferase
MDKRSLALDGNPPFGALRLPGFAEQLRRAANRLKDDPVSRRVMSLVRRLCLLGRDDPFDVDVFERCSARLYPRSNRCEKRVFLGVNSWDFEEREAIYAELKAQSRDDGRPFVFVDGGANVGLYSLFVASAAHQLGREARILAIEPDPTNLGRLNFNIAASQRLGDFQVAPYAIGAESGSARLTGGETNRGEVRLARDNEIGDSVTDITVTVKTLPEILGTADIDTIDVLKLDIEGAEYAALQGLFSHSPATTWPTMIVLEVGKSENFTDAYHLCVEYGYVLVQRTQLNAIMRRTSSESSSKTGMGNGS